MFQKVIVEKIGEETTNDSDFIVSDYKKEKFCKGKVFSSGDMATEIQKDDIVWYDKNRASNININGKMFDVMDKMNIFVVGD